MEDAYTIGEVVATTYTNPPSATRIIKEHGLELSRLVLWRCCRVYNLCQTLGITPNDTELGVAHMVRLAHFPTRKQRSMFRKTTKEGWSVRRLEAELAKLPVPAQRRGRRRVPRFVLTLNALRKFVDTHQETASAYEGAEQITPEQRKELRQTVKDARALLKLLDQGLKPR